MESLGIRRETTATFGDLLRRHRLAASLTQEALAERARISPGAIAALERGRRTAPRSDTVALLADALRLTPDERNHFVAAATWAPTRAEQPLAPPPARRAAPVGLPLPPTTLIGRDGEEAALARLLERGARLVTLTGPGGVGKTHLALQVAGAVQEAYADGAAFVDLSALRDPGLVASAVAHAVGLHDAGARQGRDLIVERLGDAELLLLLDNFEQVIEAAALVRDLIASCSGLTVLVTSRAPLRLRGEQRFPVAPLAVPAQTPSSLHEAAGYAAVRLFVARAQAVQPGFALSAENAAAVIEVCRRLDGLPLAIELAAGRVRFLPPIALLARLDQRLAALAAGPRDLPPRQRTLRSMIAWSYELLDDDEKRLFQRLGVFVGGFTLRAVEAVSRVDAAAAGEGEALDGVASLIEKNLLQPAESAEGDARFTMLETIREYALEQLTASGALSLVQERHAAFFLTLAEEADPHLRSGEREVWLARLRGELGNVRAALSWAAEAPNGAHTGLRLAAALTWFWRFYEWLHEGRSWLERMLARTEDAAQDVARGKALYGVGMLAWYQADLPTAAARTEAGVAIFRALGDRVWLATALRLLGLIRLGQDDPAAAHPILQEAHALFHQAGDTWGEAMTLYRLGLAAAALGDPSARVSYECSLELFRQAGDALGIAVVLNALAVAAAAQGDDERALGIIAESLPLARQATDRWDLARLLNNAGMLWLRRGDDRQARDLFAESLTLWQGIAHSAGIALSLAGLGSVAAARGEPRHAGRLFAVARKLFPPSAPFVSAATSVDLDQRIAAARQSLDAATFEQGWAEGQALSLDDAIAVALQHSSATRPTTRISLPPPQW